VAIPLKYSLKNVLVRWRSSVATVLIVGVVVAVYLVLNAMAEGVKKSGAATGSDENALIVRRGSDSESGSQVTREQYVILRDDPDLAQDEKKEPLISADVIVVLNLPRANGAGPANVVLRGVGEKSRGLRPQVRLVAGRWFQPGLREAIVSQRMSRRFAGMALGETLKAGFRELKIVGHFDGENSAFDSELWMDAEEARQMFDRESYYSSVVARPTGFDAMKRFQARVEADNRLDFTVKNEREYFSKQTAASEPIQNIAAILATGMAVGAIFAAMNSMYASVGVRTREIGTMRILGFPRHSVILAILIEGLCIGVVGGIFGCLIAARFQGLEAGTMSFERFSESVFKLELTPELFAQGLMMSAILGLVGSLLPALRAARMPLMASLKAV
jgi:putative ABC transport system permease protein